MSDDDIKAEALRRLQGLTLLGDPLPAIRAQIERWHCEQPSIEWSLPRRSLPPRESELHDTPTGLIVVPRTPHPRVDLLAIRPMGIA